MKKWVVEIEKESGRVETRLVPARNKCTAISNCKNEGDTVLSCVPYTGQNVKVLVGQLDTSMQKAVYIATKMFLAAKETPEEKGKPKK